MIFGNGGIVGGIVGGTKCVLKTCEQYPKQFKNDCKSGVFKAKRTPFAQQNKHKKAHKCLIMRYLNKKR